MLRKRMVTIGIMVILGISLAACTRSLSTSPAKLEATRPAATNELMNQLVDFATQTANAQAGINQPAEVAAAATQPAAASETGETTQPPAEADAEAETEATAIPAPEEPAPTETPLPTMVPVPTATPGIPTTYTIHGGETAYCLARRFDVNPSELMQINGLGTNTIINPGLTLKIPQTGNKFPGARARVAHPATYVVSEGETIYSVACVFGDVDPNAIIIANALKAPYALAGGQTIQIP